MIIRHAKANEYDFEENMDKRFGLLRAFVKDLLKKRKEEQGIVSNKPSSAPMSKKKKSADNFTFENLEAQSEDTIENTLNNKSKKIAKY